MITMPIENIDDDTLAECVDEYIKRAIAAVRGHELVDNMNAHIFISAIQCSKESEFSIEHQVTLGSDYSSKGIQKIKGNNAINAARTAVARMLMDAETPPTEVRQLIGYAEPLNCAATDEDIHF